MGKVHPWEAEVKYMFDRKGVNFEEVEQFFQEKRDLYLGRWRSKEQPKYFVTSWDEDSGWFRFYDERTNDEFYACREDCHLISSVSKRLVAEEFFAAHPEPKPWHDAKPGEVWVFKVAGLEFAAVVGSEYEVTDNVGKYNLTDFRIESAYKVYPVE